MAIIDHAPYVFFNNSSEEYTVHLTIYMDNNSTVSFDFKKGTDHQKSFDELKATLNLSGESSKSWQEFSYPTKNIKSCLSLKIITLYEKSGSFGPEEGGKTTVHYDDPDNIPPNV